MSDIPYSDPTRLYRNTRIGSVQAWPEPSGKPALTVSFYAGIMLGADDKSYISQNINLTVADARDLARVLIEAADHADKVRMEVSAPVEEAA